MIKKTPLYDVHLKLNGKMVEYAGYYLPIQYTGIIEEHINDIKQQFFGASRT